MTFSWNFMGFNGISNDVIGILNDFIGISWDLMEFHWIL
jgi:hypothetical protein